LLSLAWRSAGVDARAIMQAPLLSTSLAEFWGKRWNLAFRDLSHTYLFRPLVTRVGASLAMLAVFVGSGLVHDLVITVPARGGWSGPTLYFLLQGVGLLLERSRFGKRLGLGRGLAGRLYCGGLLLLPLPLLFPPVFIERITLPTLIALGALP
jgi:alginate O-acetyltransferase complex protein AlgI